jgi:GT2 family glycosyltransferase
VNQKKETPLEEAQVCVVILNWNNYAQTRRCIESLQQATYSNLRILIVDNASADGSTQRLQEEFKQHEFVFNEANLGFANGVNRGIRVALDDPDCAYVLLLNNDMEVEPGFLEPAVEVAARDPRVGLATGKILFGDRRDVIWSAGGYIDGLRIQGIAPAWNRLDDGQWDVLSETRWGSGAMLLLPRTTIEKVGLLPEEYFFGSEEWDYSTAVRKAGLKIMYVPAFRGYHYAGGSYKAGHPVLIVYNGVRNKLVYAQKHLSAPAWLIWKLMFRCYLTFGWPRRARWGCQTEADYLARLKAARLAFADHHGVNRIELSDLERAAKTIGPTPTWGNGWKPTNTPPELEAKL